MKYFLASGLTMVATWYILRITTRRKYKEFGRVLYRQSDMHRMMKNFFTYELAQKPIEKKSQLQQRKSKDFTKVVIVEDQAYWVLDNIFYVAETENGKVKPETASPIDTESMSKKDVKKMLFILDNLKGGIENDSGGTRNE